MFLSKLRDFRISISCNAQGNQNQPKYAQDVKCGLCPDCHEDEYSLWAAQGCMCAGGGVLGSVWACLGQHAEPVLGAENVVSSTGGQGLRQYKGSKDLHGDTDKMKSSHRETKCFTGPNCDLSWAN